MYIPHTPNGTWIKPRIHPRGIHIIHQSYVYAHNWNPNPSNSIKVLESLYRIKPTRAQKSIRQPKSAQFSKAWKPHRDVAPPGGGAPRGSGLHAPVGRSPSSWAAIHRRPPKENHLVVTSWAPSPGTGGAGSGTGEGHPGLAPLPDGPAEGGSAAADGPVSRRGAAQARSHRVHSPLVCGGRRRRRAAAAWRSESGEERGEVASRRDWKKGNNANEYNKSSFYGDVRNTYITCSSQWVCLNLFMNIFFFLLIQN